MIWKEYYSYQGSIYSKVLLLISYYKLFSLSAFAFAATVECRNGFLSHLKEEIQEEIRQGDASQGKYFYDWF